MPLFSLIFFIWYNIQHSSLTTYNSVVELLNGRIYESSMIATPIIYCAYMLYHVISWTWNMYIQKCNSQTDTVCNGV